jgi:hypothetical protein
MTTLIGGPGDQILPGVNNEPNTLYGDAVELGGHGETGGNDTLIGGNNSTNTLYGDAENMFGPSTGGIDTLIGGVGGTNTLYGDAFSASGPVTGGGDRLVSAANTTDHMWGDFDSIGGPASGGADIFAFRQDNGIDFINDFHLLEGDKIEIGTLPAQAAEKIPDKAKDHIPLLEFSDLNIQEADGNSVIQFDANDSITVVGVTDLTESDFLFVV